MAPSTRTSTHSSPGLPRGCRCMVARSTPPAPSPSSAKDRPTLPPPGPSTKRGSGPTPPKIFASSPKAIPSTPSPSSGQTTVSCSLRLSPRDPPPSRGQSSALSWPASAASPSAKMAAACISPSQPTRPTPTPTPSPSIPDEEFPTCRVFQRSALLFIASCYECARKSGFWETGSGLTAGTGCVPSCFRNAVSGNHLHPCFFFDEFAGDRDCLALNGQKRAFINVSGQYVVFVGSSSRGD